MVNIHKFHKTEILIQPPGEPREQHLGDVRQKKSLSYTKFHKRQNDWKGRFILSHFLGLLHLASKFQISQLETLKLHEVLVYVRCVHGPDLSVELVFVL